MVQYPDCLWYHINIKEKTLNEIYTDKHRYDADPVCIRTGYGFAAGGHDEDAKPAEYYNHFATCRNTPCQWSYQCPADYARRTLQGRLL